MANPVAKRAREISPMSWEWHDSGRGKMSATMEQCWLNSLERAQEEHLESQKANPNE